MSPNQVTESEPVEVRLMRGHFLPHIPKWARENNWEFELGSRRLFRPPSLKRWAGRRNPKTAEIGKSYVAAAINSRSLRMSAIGC